MLSSGSWEKVIHEKRLKQKSRDTVPLKIFHCETRQGQVVKRLDLCPSCIFLYTNRGTTFFGTGSLAVYNFLFSSAVLISWSASICLKGQCHKIFNSWFFFHESVSPSTWVYHYGPFKFFENSRLKVHHRWQTEKIFNQKNFIYLVWTHLGSRVNICIHFCLQVHFKVSATWYCSHFLPPVSLKPVTNLPPVSTTLAKMVAKFAAGVIYIGGKFAVGVVDTGGAPWEYLREFSKKFEAALMEYSGAGGKLIY